MKYVICKPINFKRKKYEQNIKNSIKKVGISRKLMVEYWTHNYVYWNDEKHTHTKQKKHLLWLSNFKRL